MWWWWGGGGRNLHLHRHILHFFQTLRDFGMILPGSKLSRLALLFRAINQRAPVATYFVPFSKIALKGASTNVTAQSARVRLPSARERSLSSKSKTYFFMIALVPQRASQLDLPKPSCARSHYILYFYVAAIASHTMRFSHARMYACSCTHAHALEKRLHEQNTI